MSFPVMLKIFSCFTLFMTNTWGVSAPLPLDKIGIIQVIEHPALDLTRKGIQDELDAQGYKDQIQWMWDSAQGNPATATQIAQKYIGQKVNLVIAIGTTAAQAALTAAQDQKTPVVFASVTDPKSAKLLGNITGVSNFVSVKDQFKIIAQLIPTKKRIGFIYNPGEANSTTLVNQMKEEAQKQGFEATALTASKTSDVTIAAKSLMGKIDAIFINNDNTALAAINGIGQICQEFSIPLFASDGDIEKSGTLALLGADQYEIGRQTGRMVAKILRGETQPQDMPIEYPSQVTVEINQKMAKILNIIIPEFLK